MSAKLDLPPEPHGRDPSVTKAAEVLGVHPNTIRAWSDAGPPALLPDQSARRPPLPARRPAAVPRAGRSTPPAVADGRAADAGRPGAAGALIADPASAHDREPARRPARRGRGAASTSPVAIRASARLGRPGRLRRLGDAARGRRPESIRDALRPPATSRSGSCATDRLSLDRRSPSHRDAAEPRLVDAAAHFGILGAALGIGARPDAGRGRRAAAASRCSDGDAAGRPATAAGAGVAIPGPRRRLGVLLDRRRDAGPASTDVDPSRPGRRAAGSAALVRAAPRPSGDRPPAPPRRGPAPGRQRHRQQARPRPDPGRARGPRDGPLRGRPRPPSSCAARRPIAPEVAAACRRAYLAAVRDPGPVAAGAAAVAARRPLFAVGYATTRAAATVGRR